MTDGDGANASIPARSGSCGEESCPRPQPAGSIRSGRRSSAGTSRTQQDRVVAPRHEVVGAERLPGAEQRGLRAVADDVVEEAAGGPPRGARGGAGGGTAYLLGGKRGGPRRAIRCRTMAASSSDAPTDTVNL